MSIIVPNGDSNNGPARNTLQDLFRALPGYVKQHKKKAVEQAQLHATHATLPRKVCKICCVAFDHAFVPKDTHVVAAVCDDCQKKLDEGYIGCVCTDKFAFIMPKPGKMDDLKGTILHVDPRVMAEIQRQAKPQ